MTEAAAGMDQARDVRTGEELDVASLEQYLSQNLEGFEGPLSVKQFPSGHSNLTYLVKDAHSEWVLRCPPKGAKQIKKGHDMGREYNILHSLEKVYPKVPGPVLYCESEDVIGAEFYLMERLNGVILRNGVPEKIGYTKEDFARLSENFVQSFVELHAVDINATGLVDIGHPEGYVDRQVTGWSERYKKAQTDEWADIDALMAWLPNNKPPAVDHASMIHNDYRYDNLILDPTNPTEIVAVLDWEMATVGDPLMDLGTTLGYWINEHDPAQLQALPFTLTAHPGNYNRTQLVERYAELSGRDTSHILFYYVYGLFKIAVILQQIYFRYKKGYTQDERFAYLNYIVQILGQVGAKALESETIDPKL